MSSLRSQGVAHLGVGFQMHIDLEHPPDPGALGKAINALGDLDVAVEITEMDVRIRRPDIDTSQKLAQQAAVYQSVAGACLSAGACDVVQTWGFTDKATYSWIPDFFPYYGAALEFDGNYAPKPAHTGLSNALACPGLPGTALPSSHPTPPPVSSPTLVDDFENGNMCPCLQSPSSLCPCNRWTGEWQARNQNGDPFPLSFPAGHGSTRAIRVDLPFQGYGQLQTFLAPNLSPVDLTAYDAVQFDVTGDDCPYWFQLAAASGVNVGDHFGHPFWASPHWTTVTIRFQDLQQRGFPSC